MASSPRVLRAIYRCALRNAAHFDRQPAMKVLLSRDPDVTPPADSLEVDAALQGFLSSAGFYVPALPRPRSAAEAVRAAFRAPRDGREGDLDQGLQAMRLLQRALNDAAALKLLPSRGAPAPAAPSAAHTASGSDAPAADASRWALLPPAPPRAATAASPLHALAAPARGVLLLSHPRLGDYFHRKVILLCDHDESGARGLVLNAPTRMRAGTLAAAHGKRGRMDEAWLAKGPGGANRVRRASLISMTRAAERLTHAFSAALAAAAAESRSRAAPAPAASTSSAEWSEASDGFEENDDDFDSFDEGDVSDDEAALDRSRGIIIEARVPRYDDDVSDEEDDESIFDDLDSESDEDDESDAPDGEAAAFALLAKEAGPTLLRKCWRHGVYSGGPVAGGAVLHACADVGGTLLLGEEGAAGGVYLGGDTARLAARLGGERSRRALRLYAGEATWHGGQLEAELARGEWLLASAAPDWVLGAAAHALNGDCMWQRAMRALGGEHADMAALPPRVGREEAPAQHPFSVRFHVL